MRYSTAPAYDPRTGTYRGKGDGSAGKKIPRDPAVKLGRNKPGRNRRKDVG